MQNLSIFTLLLICLFQSQLNAAEIDSVTTRSVVLDNSTRLINRIFNNRIREGVRKANLKQDDYENIQAGEFCDSKLLYTELRKSIFQSYTASWGLKGYDLDKQLRQLLAAQSYSILFNDSIYRDINYLEGASLKIKELSDVVNLDGYLIGLDKLGHFFAEGWEYFELTEYDNQKIRQAMGWGGDMESGKYGYSTTGIYSYSDLVANFNGWRFWNRVLQDKPDPLLGVLENFIKRPYVKCKIKLLPSVKSMKLVKAWEINADFDLSDFIDGAWDEGTNCNSYKNPVIEEKVVLRSLKVRPDFKCPWVSDDCRKAREKYGVFATQLLHPFCMIENQY